MNRDASTSPTGAASLADGESRPSWPLGRGENPELVQSLAEVKGQTQFLLYLANQIEESLQELGRETDPGQVAFLCKILGMYSSQLETKHQGLGEKIAETCQEVYVTLREHDLP